MSPGGARLVRVLVVHGVLAGEVLAVLSQHLGEDNMTLISKFNHIRFQHRKLEEYVYLKTLS